MPSRLILELAVAALVYLWEPPAGSTDRERGTLVKSATPVDGLAKALQRRVRASAQRCSVGTREALDKPSFLEDERCRYYRPLWSHDVMIVNPITGQELMSCGNASVYMCGSRSRLADDAAFEDALPADFQKKYHLDLESSCMMGSEIEPATS